MIKDLEKHVVGAGHMHKIKNIFHIHWFKFDHRSGSNVYKKCRCGKRIWRSIGMGYSPIDRRWLEQ